MNTANRRGKEPAAPGTRVHLGFPPSSALEEGFRLAANSCSPLPSEAEFHVNGIDSAEASKAEPGRFCYRVLVIDVLLIPLSALPPLALGSLGEKPVYPFSIIFDTKSDVTKRRFAVCLVYPRSLANLSQAYLLFPYMALEFHTVNRRIRVV